MLANNLTVEDEEAVQAELKELEREAVCYLIGGGVLVMDLGTDFATSLARQRLSNYHQYQQKHQQNQRMSNRKRTRHRSNRRGRGSVYQLLHDYDHLYASPHWSSFTIDVWDHIKLYIACSTSNTMTTHLAHIYGGLPVIKVTKAHFSLLLCIVCKTQITRRLEWPF